jgi:hypothetical protein
MAEQWYYVKSGEKHGPVSSSELRKLAKEGGLKPEDQIWKEGMNDWVPASRLKGLFVEKGTATPPPPPSPPTVISTQSNATEPTNRGIQSPLNESPNAIFDKPAETVVKTAEALIEWYYAEAGERKGPVSEDQLRQMVAEGRLKATDMIWKNGIPNWIPLDEVIFLAPSNPNSPPPIPATTKEGGAFMKFLLLQDRTVLAYRIALALAIVAGLLPWWNASASASESIYGQQSEHSASYGGGPFAVMCMACAAVGIYLTFANPSKFFKDKTKIAMAGPGVVIAAIAIICMSFRGGGDYNDSTGLLHGSTSMGPSLGVYLAILTGAVATVCGFMTDWSKSQPSG